MMQVGPRTDLHRWGVVYGQHASGLLRTCTQIKLLKNQEVVFEGAMDGDRDVEAQAIAVKK